MTYNKNTAFNELPDLPPFGFTESPEILRHLARAYRHLGELNGLNMKQFLSVFLLFDYLNSNSHVGPTRN